MTDLRAAVRALFQRPGFSLVAILTIAVGIGANTALFSVYDRLVLHPVTIPDPSSLVAIWTNNPSSISTRRRVSWPRYEEIRDHARSFASIGISAFDNFTLTGNGEPEQLNGQRVSATFFPTLGILPGARPQLHRRRGSAERSSRLHHQPRAVADALRRTRPGLVGETITLNGQPWQVVGIMPPRLSAPFGQVQIFAPRVFEIGGLTPVQVQIGATFTPADRAAQAARDARPGGERAGRAQPRLQGGVRRASRRRTTRSRRSCMSRRSSATWSRRSTR